MLILRSSVSIPAKRQRTEFKPSDIRSLADSIEARGLLQAPVFHEILLTKRNEETDETSVTRIYQLVAGHRRILAMDLLRAEGRSFTYAGEPVSVEYIPAMYKVFDSVIARKEAELDENLLRVDLTWQERTQALSELHKLRSESNPQQTVAQTTREVLEKAGKIEPGAPAYQVTKSSDYNELRMANVIAEHLDRPEIKNARNQQEAYQLVVTQQLFTAESELLRRRRLAVQQELRCDIKTGDSIRLMQEMDPGQVDLILTDPPYGVGAHTANYRARTVHHHTYDDTEENARTVLQAILTEGWRITKPRANLMIFTDMKHFEWLRDAASRMGWKPWRLPVIWQKSQSEGLTPWGRHGFAHVYDVIFYATKGQRGLNMRIPDILTYPRVKRGERVYAAEKPVDLLKRLIDIATTVGDLVFDPCAGSGSTLVAAKALKRHSIGIEIDPQVADIALIRTEKGDDYADFSALETLEPTSSGDAEDWTASSPESNESELPEL